MHSNPLNEFVVLIFGNSNAAIFFSFGIAFWCGWIITYNRRKFHKPFSLALKSRISALAFINEQASEDEAQAALATRFEEVKEAMDAPGPRSQELRHAWSQFRETILDETEQTLRATSRPEGYFLHLGDDTRVLAWWANIFVALGLTCTFLGIVAALTITVKSLSDAGGSGNMTPALIELLSITSVKFWTSIAGVGASIILRFFDRSWHSQTQQKLEEICDRLERGTLFSPAQRIAAEQLTELKQQSVALSEFSTKLAIGIGDALEQKMQPMVSVLNGIHGSIDEFKNGSFNQIGKELGEALSKNAGNEMQQLAVALTGMTENLGSITQKLEGSGQAANDQIAAAARDFALASDQMRNTFGALNDRIDTMATRLTGEAESAVQRTGNYFAEQRAGYEALAERNTALLGSAATALEAATTRASEGMGQAIDDVLTRAAEQSSKVMDAAFSGFGERFDQASGGMIETLRTTAGQMERIAASIERSTAASDRHSDKLIEAGSAADGIATALAGASTEFQAAAAPIREATTVVSAAVNNVKEMLKIQSDAAIRQSESVTLIAEKLGETAEAASRAWTQYRDRFEDVDKSLAEALNKIKDASSEHASSLNEQTGKVDKALADAIDRLAPALDPLGELADTIEDLIARLKAQG